MTERADVDNVPCKTDPALVFLWMAPSAQLRPFFMQSSLPHSIKSKLSNQVIE